MEEYIDVSTPTNNIHFMDIDEYIYEEVFEETLTDELLAAHQKRITTFFVALGIIIPLGVLLNTLAFTVLIKSSSLLKTSTARYLIALSVADTIYLIGEFLAWLNLSDTQGQILDIEFSETNAFWCRLQHFLRYYGKFTSIWLTVAITLEKCIAIFYPITFDKYTTIKVASAVIIMIFIIGGVLTSFTFIYLAVFDNGFYSYCSYTGSYHQWNWSVNKIGSIFIPCGLLLLFTTPIVVKLHVVATQRNNNALLGNRNVLPVEKQLSRMLIAVASTTLLLRVPYTIAYAIYDKRYDFWDEENVAFTWFEFRLIVAKDICFILATANFAINFFLFYVSGSNFRRNMIAMVACKKAGIEEHSMNGTVDSIVNVDEKMDQGLIRHENSKHSMYDTKL